MTSTTEPLKHASELDFHGRAYAERAMSGVALLIQRMRYVRYLATETYPKRFTDREILAEERTRLGITPTAIRNARERQAKLAAEAESLGYVGSEVVMFGRKAAMDDFRTRYADSGLYSTGDAYFPSPTERIRRREAILARTASITVPFPKNVFLTPRKARYGYWGTPEQRKAKAVELRAWRAAKPERDAAEARAKAKAEAIEYLKSIGKQTPERVELANKLRSSKRSMMTSKVAFGPKMSAPEASKIIRADLRRIRARRNRYARLGAKNDRAMKRIWKQRAEKAATLKYQRFVSK